MKVKVLISNHLYKSEDARFYGIPETVSYREIKRHGDVFANDNLIHFKNKPFIVKSLCINSAKHITVWLQPVNNR